MSTVRPQIRNERELQKEDSSREESALNRDEILSIKKSQLEVLREYRSGLYQAPKLKQLFLELTLRCNSFCFHCGSRCTPHSPDGLPVEEYLRVIDEVKAHYGNQMTQICLTGGEPLLYRDFFCLDAGNPRQRIPMGYDIQRNADQPGCGAKAS